MVIALLLFRLELVEDAVGQQHRLCGVGIDHGREDTLRGNDTRKEEMDVWTKI